MPGDLKTTGGAQARSLFTSPSLAVPKGGGAIRGMGEKFAANPVTGTASVSVPLPASPGRSGFGPKLSLAYDSGSGNGPFGFGWSLSLASISRKTDKGLPQYFDSEESDTFILSGAEDLVPARNDDGTRRVEMRSVDGVEYVVHRYLPRIEGLFARIERWTRRDDGDIHWRSISRENIATLYGKTAESRVANPADATQVYSWLICESRDDKGNAMVFGYKAENSDGVDTSQVHERNRTVESRSANRYLKSIRYGNQVSHLVQPDLSLADWRFEIVFDYGEHDANNPAPGDGGAWLCRNDAFSAYRPGFEVRTYRLCQRVLMFHHFPAELDVGADCLVRSVDFAYRDLRNNPDDRARGHPVASFIAAVTQCGYKRIDATGYIRRTFPPVEFEYSQVEIDEQIREIDAASLTNLPVGQDDAAYRWVDLDGEGVSGILTEQAGAWFYKPNRGNGEFGPLETVARKPSLVALHGGRQQLIDLAGDGQLDLAEFEGANPGFHERTHDENWEVFRPFHSLPNIPWDEPNLRFVDLNGDGHADVLISEHQVFTWHASLAEGGFGPAQRVQQSADEEKGPRLVLADATQSIYLADMCGDGLTDLVRIRNGEVCYWPNLGYGRFGAKVTMDRSPLFDAPDQFDQQRVRLADIDGSGNNDIIYLGRDGVRLYFNEAGNRWGSARRLGQFPQVDHLSSVSTVDLLGNGTACLVWSSPLPGEVRRPLRYVDLMGGSKPHLLIKTSNNLGAESHVRYAPSTKFYLEDKRNGRPWITRLPFPVHVVDRVETFDRISRNRLVTRYAYHHGYFDGVEREFRGFGMVEQWDTEELAALARDGAPLDATNVDAASHVPPAHTKTWFHTGVYMGRDHVSDFFAGLIDDRDRGEYFREPGLTDEQARQQLLPDSVLPAGLSLDEEREACRSLKGTMLRQEIYALDSTAKAANPYTVTEQNFTIRRVRPRAGNRHAVFFTHAREAITFHYERNPADPRITHTLTLEVDEHGNVLKEAAVGYGRRAPDGTLTQRDQETQARILITYSESAFTNAVEAADAYRTPMVCESRTFELTGLAPTAGENRYSLSEMLDAATGAETIAYDQSPSAGLRQKRLLEHARTLFRRDDLAGALPLGKVESRGLPFETYTLAFTPGLVNGVFGGRVADAMLETEGGFVHSEGESTWWIPSGRVFHSPGNSDTPVQELTHAREHFFLTNRFRNPFHTDTTSTETTVTYDAYDLLVVATRDAVGNVMSAVTKDDAGTSAVRNDYRVLQPYWMTDANGNRTHVAFDALGMVVATAVMGKPLPATVEGDSLAGVVADLTDSAVAEYLANPPANGHSILQRASTRIVYDLFAFHRTKLHPHPQPAVVCTLARETHDSASLPVGGLRIRHSFSYSDGFEREIQQKAQAEPGPVPRRDAAGTIVMGADGLPEMTANGVSPRWVGSRWTVFNNKGKPVREYEPFFTDSHGFEFDVRVGVSPVLFYDPVGRVVGALHPNHTWEKVVFDAWRQVTWDMNDTVLVADPRNDADVQAFFARLPETEYLPSWHALREPGTMGPDEQAAARKTVLHAATPIIAHADSLGRAFLSIAHNRFKRGDDPASPPIEEFHATRVVLDAEGNQREVIDAKDRSVMRYDYDMLGHRVHQASMEAGERWTLDDVAGKPLYGWDSRGHRFRTVCDPLRRPVETYLREGAGPERLVGKTIYGESQPNPEDRNQRGHVIALFDQAGVVTTDEFDFKGNLIASRRQLAQDFKTILDWSGAVPLEADTFANSFRYDAINRAVEVVSPDQSVVRRRYTESNLLEGLDVNLHGVHQNGVPVWTPFVTGVAYDAGRRRVRIDYGNGASTAYRYDPRTSRLVHLVTRRDAAAFPDDCPQPPPVGFPGCQVQNLRYTFDPVGNIAHLRDDAQQTLYFRNRRVEPSADYVYDAAYRLIEATGREHLGQATATRPSSYNDKPRVGVLLSASDGNAMGRYLERYAYDAVGNLEEVTHRGSDPASPGWTRVFACDEPSLLQPSMRSNRLSHATTGGSPETFSAAGDGYDEHGNLLRMPQLHAMHWDYKDQLRMTQRQAVNADDEDGLPRHGERTWYVYDMLGQRVRKVTELASGPVKDERIYVAGFEIHRRHGAQQVSRETLHVMDDTQRIALVETRTQGIDGAPAQLTRYQIGNHLGSASLELDGEAAVVSYEEYTPYGSTSYQAVRSQTETPKRYRYTRMERDEESGLSFHTARYYAPWLGRWTSTDPIGLGDGVNLYRYANSNPVVFLDRSGLESKQQKWQREFDARIPHLKNIDIEYGTFDAGQMTPTGIRVPIMPGNFLEPRPFYEKKEAAMLAYQGFIHYAELVEANLGQRAMELACARFRNCAPIPDVDMNLAGFVGWAYRAAQARNTALGGLGLKPLHTGTTSIIAFFKRRAAERAAAAAAIARAGATQRNVLDVPNATRTTTSATGKETFVHTTNSSVVPDVAAVSIVDAKKLNMSPGGQYGQWGQGAYAYEGTLATEQGKITMVQFSVPAGTAIERIAIPGQRTIVRLVPAEGAAVPVVNPVTNLSEEALKKASVWFEALKK